MLIGVPGSGKSTWIRNNLIENSVVVSTDNLIEAEALKRGKTYDEIFDEYIQCATMKMRKQVQKLVKEGTSVIWDQCNVSRKGRLKKISMFTKDYHTVAVVFAIPEPEELKKRLSQRPGKNVPDYAMDYMIKNYQLPLEDEFDEIIMVKQ